MKLPSISQIITDAKNIFIRFPLVLINAFVGTVCALILIEFNETIGPNNYFRILFGAILGFPLLAGITLIAEEWKWNRRTSLGIQLGGILLLAVYVISLPRELSDGPAIHGLRLLTLTLGMIVFALTAPFIKRGSEIGFWNFCRANFVHVFTTGLFAFVLWGGIAIALVALDKLFGVNIAGERYGQLWVIVLGVFAVWFFLGGIPRGLESLAQVSWYPKSLKTFSQYILFPLVLMYFVILYAYLGKILVAWNWPHGWVSGLILGFIAAGLLALLLVHPIKEMAENLWMKKGERWFHIVVIPLIVMLSLAVWERISAYGVTETRYLGLVAAVWILVVVITFLFAKRSNILFLAGSLCIALVVVSTGPWSMFAFSERSQVARLEKILTSNGILTNGGVRIVQTPIEYETAREISSILAYLSELHGYDAIQPWFSEDLKRNAVEQGGIYKEPEAVAKLMGVTYVIIAKAPMDGVVNLRSDRTGALDIRGYERMLRGQRVASGELHREFPGIDISYSMNEEMKAMTVFIRRENEAADTVLFDLKPLVERLMSDYDNIAPDRIPPEKMSLVGTNKSSSVKVCFTSMKIRREGGMNLLVSFEADIAY